MKFFKNIKFMLIMLAVFIASTTTSAYSQDSLTVVSFGGAYGAAQKEHMIDPYVKQTGTRILFEDYSGGVAELKAQVDSGNVSWDVLDIEYVDLERACSEGMLEVIPLDKLPAGDNGVAWKEDFVPNALSECAVGNIIWSIIFAYRNDMKNKPTKIANLFDTKKFPGKRAFRKRPQINLEWALIADGVAYDQVYKVLSTKAGVDRAFKKLDAIKDDIIWFESWSQAPQLLSDGSVVIAQSANGRIYNAIHKDSAKLTIVWDAQAYDFDGWAIPKGSKNFDKALDFIFFSTKSKPLAGLQDVAYGPTRHSSSKYLRSEVKNDLPSAHLETGFKVSGNFWADNDASLTERFSAWLLR